mgnify:CR=1 FL=1
MKTKRFLSTLSLIINLLIVFLTFDAVSYYFRADIVREATDEVISAWICMRYFTTLSNIFVAIAAAVLVIIYIKNAASDSYDIPKWAITLKYVATVSVSVTFLTVVLFLSPITALGGKGYFSLFENNAFVLHFLTPVLAIISFIFFDGSDEIPFKSTFLTVIPTIIYSFVYIPMVAIAKVWPDFYWFTFGGHYYVAPIVAVVMYAFTYGIGVIEWHLRRKATESQ